MNHPVSVVRTSRALLLPLFRVWLVCIRESSSLLTSPPSSPRDGRYGGVSFVYESGAG